MDPLVWLWIGVTCFIVGITYRPVIRLLCSASFACLGLALIGSAYRSSDDIRLAGEYNTEDVKGAAMNGILNLVPSSYDKVIAIRVATLMVFLASAYIFLQLRKARYSHLEERVRKESTIVGAGFLGVVYCFFPMIILYHTKQLFSIALIILQFQALDYAYSRRFKQCWVGIGYCICGVILAVEASKIHYLSIYASVLLCIGYTIRASEMVRLPRSIKLGKGWGQACVLGFIVVVAVTSSKATEIFIWLTYKLPNASAYSADSWSTDGIGANWSVLYGLVITVPLIWGVLGMARSGGAESFRWYGAGYRRYVMLVCASLVLMITVTSLLMLTTEFYAVERVRTSAYYVITWLLPICLEEMVVSERKTLKRIVFYALPVGAIIGIIRSGV